MDNKNLTKKSNIIGRFLTIIILGALVGVSVFYILRKLGY